MIYKRTAIEVDAIKMTTSGNISGQEFEQGDYIVTYEDGSFAVVPVNVFESNYKPVGTNTTETPKVVAVEPAQPQTTPIVNQSNDKGLVCISCGAVVESSFYDRNSGMCHDCMMVKCPTCQNAVKRSDMVGQYCRTYCLRKG